MNFTSNEKKELLDISKMMKERYKRIEKNGTIYMDGPELLGEIQTSRFKDPDQGLNLIKTITMQIERMRELEKEHNEKLKLYDSIIRKLEE